MDWFSMKFNQVKLIVAAPVKVFTQKALNKMSFDR